MKNLKYLLFGVLFGVVLTKTEVISWWRIQEMFRFQSFHMYGVIGSAVVVGMLSVFILKKTGAKSIDGEELTFGVKKFDKGNIIGGLIFGIGWGITGACPGPMMALVGSGITIMVLAIISAVAGTWVYGLLRNKLPH
ncbi:MAG: YeeE/YedE family protein [Saprospiraceae bacterium]|nr:YeeE/YedE family protein [Saprospiraceae bacterium]MCC6414240.1 YeeE/YedE family protein [Saprospiraceae bacterium]